MTFRKVIIIKCKCNGAAVQRCSGANVKTLRALFARGAHQDQL